MSEQRTDLGFGAELEGFDPADWAPAAKPRPKVAPEERVARRELAEATGFRSREPVPEGQGSDSLLRASSQFAPEKVSEPVKRPRRRRTGRNAQFNIKTRPETIDAFCAVADAQGWGLGETLEKAVILLQQQFGGGQGET